MEVQKYWEDIDFRLEHLIKDGFVKLPSLKHFGLESVASKISNDMSGSTFAELCPSHDKFIGQLSMSEYLTPKLFDIARKKLGFKGDISNQYHIARRVEAGNSKEMYRAHFDSHLFTMVLPGQLESLFTFQTQENHREVKLVILLEKLTISVLHLNKEWKNSRSDTNRSLMIFKITSLYYLLEIAHFTQISKYL